MAENEQTDSDLIIEQQQTRWANGDRVSVENLIIEHTDAVEQPELMLDLIYSEILLREDHGESPEEGEYTARFPGLKVEIARQFQLHRALQPAAAAGISTGPNGGLTVPMLAHETGQHLSIPGFELQQIVGRGGSGVAYKALDTTLNRVVAVKLLLGGDSVDETHRARLRREAEASASLHHPGIVQIHQVGEVKGSPFLVMEFLDGGSLADRLSDGPLPVDDAVKVASLVAQAVHHAHTQGIVHRDLKPGNVLLDASGQPQVCDFGLARRLDSEHTLHATGDVVGTPAYMAPEQARGETVDERSDVYALGAVLYESLCGRSPFQAATPWEILNQVMTSEAVPLRQLNSSLPQDLETICQRCLEKDPGRRYGSAQEVADELGRFQDGQPILARPVGPLQRMTKWCRRNRGEAALAAISIGLLLALGIGSTIAAFRLSSANDSILEEQGRVKAAEEIAVQDRTAAIDALNNLVDSLYDDLSTNAATIKTRERVVDAAIDGLGSITQIAGDRKADRTTMMAYQRMAELMSLRGSNDEAEENFKTAIKLARALVQQSPNEIGAKRELAISIGSLGLHFTRINRAEDAAAFGKESVELLRQILKTNPNDVVALRQMVIHHQQQLDTIWADAKDPDAAIEFGTVALSDTERLLELSTDESRAHYAAQAIHFRVGRAHLDSGAPQTASIHFDKAQEHIELAIKLQPDNPDLKSASAVLDRAHAMVKVSLGDPEESAELMGRAIVTFQQLALADPDNVQQQTQIANTQSLMSSTLHALGRNAESLAVARDATESYEKLLRRSPKNSTYRILIAESYFKMATSQLTINAWADASDSYQQMLRYLKGEEFGEPATGGAAVGYGTLATELNEAVTRLLNRPSESQTATGECIALMLAARKDSQTSQSELLAKETLQLISNVNPGLNVKTFSELFEYIHGLEQINPMFAVYRSQFEARVHAFRARNLAESESADLQQQSAEYVHKSIKILKALAANPYGVPMINSEPDLKWIRNTSEFKAAGIGATAR